ncbi:MAG: isoprenoid biosynthesis glyoxalase ElbB [Alphaproteobacteria bacterium]|nr:isoprenoid biosynthesis glyoxalase ElbB [Alphaproteobacteria bacterium]
MSKINPKFAVILAGCGNFDGSEIHETTLGLLAIDEQGGSYDCYAPNEEQGRTLNFYTKQVIAVKGEPANRNMLQEGARIARGQIKPLSELNIEEYDAVIFPGGQGTINNWCNYAQKGINCDVLPEIAHTMEKAYALKKWIGAMCIAPVIVAKVLGKNGVHLTIGNDKQTADNIEKMGAIHEVRTAIQACIDKEHRIATTPCYMLAKSIKEIYAGNTELVKGIIENL